MEAGHLTQARRTRRRRNLTLRLLPWLALLPAFAATADAQEARTREVKAAFILNIARFVEWPASAFAHHDREIHLCLYRSNPLGGATDTIRGKQVRGRSLQIRTVQSFAAPEGCNILFVPPSELHRFEAEPHTVTPGQPLLTITDGTAVKDRVPFARHILVTLVREQRRIGFQIDRHVLKHSGLNMSSELLKLGRIVDRGG
jgi:hypothetical protein